MRVARKTAQAVCAVTVLAAQCALTGYLLACRSYFAMTHAGTDFAFGLTGLQRDDEFFSYAKYRERCEDPDPLCGFVGDLETGGTVLMALLVLALALEAGNGAAACGLRWLLMSTIDRVEAGEPVPAAVKVSVRVAKAIQVATLLDPFVLLAGVVSWTVKSRFAEIGSQYPLSASVGLVLLVLRTAVSLAAAAFHILRLLDNWRSNQPLLQPPDTCEKSRIIYTEKSVPPALTFEDTKS